VSAREKTQLPSNVVLGGGDERPRRKFRSLGGQNKMRRNQEAVANVEVERKGITSYRIPSTQSLTKARLNQSGGVFWQAMGMQPGKLLSGNRSLDQL